MNKLIPLLGITVLLLSPGLWATEPFVAVDDKSGGFTGTPGKPLTLRSAPDEEAAFFLSRSFNETSDWKPAGDGLWVTLPGRTDGCDVRCVWHV